MPNSDKITDSGTVAEFARSLREKPAYALVLGICVVCGTGSVVTGVIALSENQLWALAVAAGSFVFAGAFGLKAIDMEHKQEQAMADRGRRIDRTPKQRVDASSVPAKYQEGVTDVLHDVAPENRDFLRRLSRNLNLASDVQHAVFKTQVEDQKSIFQHHAELWAIGHLEIHDSVRGLNILASLYEAAESSVFSTSAADFSSAFWRTNAGQKLLEAHGRSRAQVTRVFVFDEKRDVTLDDMKVIEAQSALGITTLFYFDKEDSFFEFDPKLRNDFMIIDDGGVVGITQATSGAGEPTLGASWYFDNAVERNRCAMQKDKLLEPGRCLNLAEFQEWFGGRSDSQDGG